MLTPRQDDAQRRGDEGCEGGSVVVGRTEQRQGGGWKASWGVGGGGVVLWGGFFIHFYDHIDKVSSVPSLLGNTATLSWIEL